jgi:LacI family transcriptional regulator
MRGKRVTIASIADAAGVSVATVSKVLNGRDEVAPKTRKQVQALLDSSGYQRRRKSVAKRVGLIDFVINGLETAWAAELLRGAEAEAYRQRSRLILTVTHDRFKHPRDWTKSLAAQRSDGVVLVTSRVYEDVVERLRAMNIPLVIVDPVGGFGPDVHRIGATNFAGGFAATEHLIELGHRKIAVIGGPADMICSEERIAGYRAALDRYGIPVVNDYIKYGDFYTSGGRNGAESLLAGDDPPTAIFAGADQQARGVYDVAEARGLRIPEDLSVIGFDDVEICEWMSPRLTTIRQPLAQMAALAIRTVLEGPETFEDQPTRIEMATSLVIRDSTAAPSVPVRAVKGRQRSQSSRI